MSSICYMAEALAGPGAAKRDIFLLLPEIEATRTAYLVAILLAAPEIDADILRAEADAVRTAVHGIADLITQRGR